MFFQSRHIKQAKHLLHAATKLLRYRRDLLKPAQAEELTAGIHTLQEAMSARDAKTIEAAMETLDNCCVKIAPPRKDAGWRENCEVILVAIVIAVGVRAYFLQPFKIPTGSMQPTLNGIVGTPTDRTAPNLLQQAAEYVWLGRNYVRLLSPADNNEVLEFREIKRARFFIFTEIVMTHSRHVVYMPPATLTHHFHVRPRSFRYNRNGERIPIPGSIYAKGQTIVNGYVDTGDQVFVDKVTFNFRHPKRGEVFVFKTTGIKRIEEGLNPAFGSQYYIKRLAGLPGDNLRITPPQLFINDQPAQEWTLQRVMSLKDGYNGYSNHSRDGDNHGPAFFYLGNPEAAFQVPERAYFALGDNSFNSSDSRHWGIVPEKNLVGRGFVVYWPFSRHWGWIR